MLLCRNAQKQVFKVNFSQQAMAGKAHEQYNKYKTDMGNDWNSRIQKMKLARKKYANNDQTFVCQERRSKHSVVPCSRWRHHSLVCKGSETSSKPLYNQTAGDIAEVNENIREYHVGDEHVQKQIYMQHTNRTESSHRTLKIRPKNKNYPSTYSARCFSSVHSDTIGMANSILEVNEHLGASKEWQGCECVDEN